MEALAKGMTTDEDGHAVTLDAQLTGRMLFLLFVKYNFDFYAK